MDKFEHRLIFNPYLLNEQQDICPRRDKTEARTAPTDLRDNHVLSSLTELTNYREKRRN